MTNEGMRMNANNDDHPTEEILLSVMLTSGRSLTFVRSIWNGYTSFVIRSQRARDGRHFDTRISKRHTSDLRRALDAFDQRCAEDDGADGALDSGARRGQSAP